MKSPTPWLCCIFLPTMPTGTKRTDCMAVDFLNSLTHHMPLACAERRKTNADTQHISIVHSPMNCLDAGTMGRDTAQITRRHERRNIKLSPFGGLGKCWMLIRATNLAPTQSDDSYSVAMSLLVAVSMSTRQMGQRLF